MNSCGNKNNMHCQPFPESGPLSKNKDLNLAQLKRKLGHHLNGTDEIYAYILSSVKTENGFFCQTGCAPNFQGGVITLCTCKHQMRTRRDRKKWIGVWIAGFTSRAHIGRHHLFYMMRVFAAFESHLELWHHSGLPQNTKLAKYASKDQFGDLFRPLNRNASPFNFESYAKPISGHKHQQTREDERWHSDINYQKSAKHPFLLVGQPSLSFLWTRPLISIENLPRDYLHCYDMGLFFSRLKSISTP